MINLALINSCGLLCLTSATFIVLGNLELACWSFLGGLFWIADFLLLRRSTYRAVTAPRATIQIFAAGRFMLRFALLGLCVALLLIFTNINIIGFLIGLSVALFGIMSYAYCYYIIM